MTVGIVCDFSEERWYSMDLAGELLMSSLPLTGGVHPTSIRPAMPLLFSALPFLGASRFARNVDRMVGRQLHYERYLKRLAPVHDLYHVVDHSYANLVHALPAGCVVVSCHDMDAFRCLFEPENEPRAWAFRRLSHRIWNGLQKAARIVCSSRATRDELTSHCRRPGIDVVPLPVHPDFSARANPADDAEATRLLGPVDPASPELLHVGSVAPRKRIDFLLDVFAGVRKRFPAVRLVRVGGEFTPAQTELARRLDLSSSITVLPELSRRVIAAVYRRATAVLLPSEREGFGFPVAEALCCGAPVIASDIAVLRETGGEAAYYCRRTDVHAWVDRISASIAQRPDAARDGDDNPHRAARIGFAERFSPVHYAERIAAIYREVLQANA